MRLAGLDEAALGPRVGPFAAALAVFDAPGADGRELYDVLAAAIRPVPGRGDDRLAVGDSKRIYSPARGAGPLEEGVLAFLDAAGTTRPATFGALLELLAPPEDRRDLRAAPWLEGIDALALPWAADPVRLDRRSGLLARALRDAGVAVRPPRLRLVPASAFNRELDAGGGKGAAVRRLIEPLLAAGLDPGPSEGPLRLTVDRQGGRRYYGAWLADLLPGAPLRASEEGPVRSAYSAGNRTVEFLVGADGLRLETALASMTAKYARESAMLLFNRWWTSRAPGLAPTAGYPADARRFLRGLARAGALPRDLDRLVRKS